MIAGGEAKGADFSQLKPVVAEHARAVLLLGRDAKLLEAVFTGVVPIYQVADMSDAVKTAAEVAQHGDIVLLSPACASFDMYENYQHRGQAFGNAVHRLIKSKTAC